MATKLSLVNVNTGTAATEFEGEEHETTLNNPCKGCGLNDEAPDATQCQTSRDTSKEAANILLVMSRGSGTPIDIVGLDC